MSHKRGRDKKANDKQVLIALNDAAYCNLEAVPYDAMLKTAQYAERHKLERFADTLPVFWPRLTPSQFVIDDINITCQSCGNYHSIFDVIGACLAKPAFSRINHDVTQDDPSRVGTHADCIGERLS